MRVESARKLAIAVFSLALFIGLISFLKIGFFSSVDIQNKSAERLVINSLVSTLEFRDPTVQISEEISFQVLKPIKGLSKTTPEFWLNPLGVLYPSFENPSALWVNTFKDLEVSIEDKVIKYGLSEDSFPEGEQIVRLDYQLNGIVIDNSKIYFRQNSEFPAYINQSKILVSKKNGFNISIDNINAFIETDKFIQMVGIAPNGDKIEAPLPEPEQSVSVTENEDGISIQSMRRLKPLESLAVIITLP